MLTFSGVTAFYTLCFALGCEKIMYKLKPHVCKGLWLPEMADRRKQQNFTALPHYLTGSIWDAFAKLPREKCQAKLFLHCWLLGLRCPSEPSINMIHNLLLLGVHGGETRPSSCFQRYQELQQLKHAWKRFKMAKKDEDNQYQEYLETLPADQKDLPHEYFLSAFAEESFVPCRVLGASK